MTQQQQQQQQHYHNLTPNLASLGRAASTPELTTSSSSSLAQYYSRRHTTNKLQRLFPSLGSWSKLKDAAESRQQHRQKFSPQQLRSLLVVGATAILLVMYLLARNATRITATTMPSSSSTEGGTYNKHASNGLFTWFEKYSDDETKMTQQTGDEATTYRRIPTTASTLRCPRQNSKPWVAFADEDGSGKIWLRTRGHRHRLAVILPVEAGVLGRTQNSKVASLSPSTQPRGGGPNNGITSMKKLRTMVQGLFARLETAGIDYSIFVVEEVANNSTTTPPEEQMMIAAESDNKDNSNNVVVSPSNGNRNVRNIALARAVTALLKSHDDITFDQFALLVGWQGGIGSNVKNATSASHVAASRSMTTTIDVSDLLLRRGEQVRAIRGDVGWLATRAALRENKVEILPTALHGLGKGGGPAGTGPQRQDASARRSSSSTVASTPHFPSPTQDEVLLATKLHQADCFRVDFAGIIPFELYHQGWENILGTNGLEETTKKIDADGRYHVIPATVWLKIKVIDA
ncbi:hypothetical protein RI054_18g82050 [Pseudoscourfieldia marina]